MPNPLFSNRADDEVLHDPNDGLDKRALPKQKPDRIYGLKETSNLKELLKPHTILRHSPFTDGLLWYPFLILEAKPEISGHGFSAVEDQTAFPIRTLLKIQFELQSITDTDSFDRLGPLV